MQEFTTADTATEEERPTATFTLDGVVLHARKPKVTAMMDLADLAELDMQDPKNGLAIWRGARGFIDDCLLPESRDHILARLYDPDDNFEVTNLAAILTWLTEEFTGKTRPTSPSGGSSAARGRTGRPSTARSRSRVSTRPDSAATG